MYEYLQIGKIVNTHGVKGELKVLPLTDDPERYNKLKTVLLDRNDNLENYKVEGVKYFKGFVILKLAGIDTVEAALALKELYLVIDRKNAVKLPKDSYFICDLIGCEVRDLEGKLLGKLKEVFSTGSNDVFVVTGEDGKELLLPALKSVVKEISPEEGKITVEVPEGL